MAHNATLQGPVNAGCHGVGQMNSNSQIPFQSSPNLSSQGPNSSTTSSQGLGAGLPTSTTGFMHAWSTNGSQIPFHSQYPSTAQETRHPSALPKPLPPTSSINAGNVVNPVLMSSPLATDGVSDTNTDFNGLLCSLTETTKLYDLPRGDLERLIGDIVHEDGFVKLVGFTSYTTVPISGDTS